MDQSQPECGPKMLRKSGNDLYARALEQMERELFPRVLAECGWNRCKAAKKLGISRRTLHDRMKLYGIYPPKSTHGTARRDAAPKKPRAVSAIAFGRTSVIEDVVGCGRG